MKAKLGVEKAKTEVKLQIICILQDRLGYLDWESTAERALERAIDRVKDDLFNLETYQLLIKVHNKDPYILSGRMLTKLYHMIAFMIHSGECVDIINF